MLIVHINKLLVMPEFEGVDDFTLKRKLDSIESLIRSYTNNNFQNRMKRFSTPSSEEVLCGCSDLIRVGDTVQITESVNQGLYIVESVKDGNTVLDSPLYDAKMNLVTKVEYPAAIVEGVINLLLWDFRNRDKVGIRSETISRHSVTYFEQDVNNQLMGYPATLLGFLKPFIKARF